MQADRELLEMAAKAAGMEYSVEEWEDGTIFALRIKDRGGWWNPFNSDGDAMRLAVDLALVVRCYEGSIIVDGGGISAEEHDVADRYSATRRAIVRAAAAIGEGMG